jgi:hypothetical protein
MWKHETGSDGKDSGRIVKCRVSELPNVIEVSLRNAEFCVRATLSGGGASMTESQAKKIAQRHGLGVGGAGVTFSGNYKNKGLYAYIPQGGKYDGMAFFGHGGGAEEQGTELAFPMYRPWPRSGGAFLDRASKATDDAAAQLWRFEDARFRLHADPSLCLCAMTDSSGPHKGCQVGVEPVDAGRAERQEWTHDGKRLILKADPRWCLYLQRNEERPHVPLLLWTVGDQFEASEMFGLVPAPGAEGAVRIAHVDLDNAYFGGIDEAAKGVRVSRAMLAMKRRVAIARQTLTAEPAAGAVAVDDVRRAIEAGRDFSEDRFALAALADKHTTMRVLLGHLRSMLEPDELLREGRWRWFKENVLTLHGWFLESPEGHYFRSLLKVGREKMEVEELLMNAVVEEVSCGARFLELLLIEDEDIITRQDDPRVGIMADEWALELLPTTAPPSDGTDPDSSSADPKALASAAALRQQYNLDLYLPKLRLVGAALLPSWNAWVKATVQAFLASPKGAGQTVTTRLGPLKGLSRCRAKVSNDYSDKAWPGSAHVLDILRASVILDSAAALVDAQQHFRDALTRGEGLALARVKNGFAGGKRPSPGGYRDLKLIVVFAADAPGVGQTKMCCELQFQIRDMHERKKRQHCIYEILRDEAFFVAAADGAAGLQ